MIADSHPTRSCHSCPACTHAAEAGSPPRADVDSPLTSSICERGWTMRRAPHWCRRAAAGRTTPAAVSSSSRHACSCAEPGRYGPDGSWKSSGSHQPLIARGGRRRSSAGRAGHGRAGRGRPARRRPLGRAGRPNPAPSSACRRGEPADRARSGAVQITAAAQCRMVAA